MIALLLLLFVTQDLQAVFNRAVADFENGRFKESAAGFDSLAKAVPERAPYLWQRGIALYYAGRYDDCRRQFESHRAVNPDDVENAFEAIGIKDRALEHITIAAADRFAGRRRLHAHGGAGPLACADGQVERAWFWAPRASQIAHRLRRAGRNRAAAASRASARPVRSA